MKIVVDLTSLSYHLSGIERYALCVTDKMIDQDRKNKYVLVFRNEIHPVFKNRIDGNGVSAIILTGNNKLVFLQITLTNALFKIKADKFIFFAFPSPILFRKKGIINTIHDMGAWDSSDEMTLLSKIYFRISYRNAAKISEKIVTVSRFSKKRIINILYVKPSKVVVVYSGVYEKILADQNEDFDTVKSKYCLPDKYIMSLSTLEPRKNIPMLIKAFESIAEKVDYDLVLVGRKGWKVDELLKNNYSKKRVHFTGFVDDEGLPSIYRHAMCFVFPSLYEGFGLPPVEALALGTPVISSDAASLPEVLMGQAKYFHYDSTDELVAILDNLNETVINMPHSLNGFQKKKYCFEWASKKILRIIDC